MFDIIVIGAGPAGLTAAIYALRAGKSVLVIEKASFGGQITHSPKIENYPSHTSISGNELAELMVDQAISQGAEFEMGEVVSIEKSDGVFTVSTEDGAFESKTVVAAVGVKHRTLSLEVPEAAIESISYCAVCDGAFYKDREVIVVGGGNSALQEALMLSEIATKVTVVQNLPFFTGEKRLLDKLLPLPNVETYVDSVVTAIDGDGETVTVTIAQSGEAKVLKADGVFVAIGLEPKNEIFSEISSLDERGYFASGEDCLTSTEGFFVAGDCRSKAIRQITTATADGAVAALAACRYLDA